MTLGFIAAEARATLDALAVKYPYVQLHTGDPGAAGTANVGSAPRVSVANGPAATTSVTTTAANAGAASFAPAAAEDYTHFTRWTAATGGSCGCSGTVTGNAVAAGDTFVFNPGALTLTLANAG